MLRLVHPAPAGNSTDPPARRKGARSPSLSLTADEVRHFRIYLRNLARAYGTWGCLATVMGMNEKSLHNARGYRGRRPSGALVIRAAQAGGVSVESVLSGVLGDASRCPTCGHRSGSGQAGGAR